MVFDVCDVFVFNFVRCSVVVYSWSVVCDILGVVDL